MKLRMLPLGVPVWVRLKNQTTLQGTFIKTIRNSDEFIGRILSLVIRVNGSTKETSYDLEEIQEMKWDVADQIRIDLD